MDKNEMAALLDLAKDAQKNSYSPYSEFSVGVALLAENGKIYKGCNVENSSFGATCCAERVALFSAVADGCGGFFAMAIVGKCAPCMPCGICRQVMQELCGGDFQIIYENEDGEAQSIMLSELLPHAFEFKENK